MFHSLTQANLKVVVWIALSEDNQKICKNSTIPAPGQKTEEDRPKNGTNPYPIHVRVNKINTFTLWYINSLLGIVLLHHISNHTMFRLIQSIDSRIPAMLPSPLPLSSIYV